MSKFGANSEARLSDPELLERLAAIEHERWSSWQRYVHDHCRRAADGSLTIPSELVERWSKQSVTPYAQLSDSEKESDRDQVRRYLPTIAAALIADIDSTG
jgi:hypothetical protein